jgi:hypothetical protein
MRALASFVMAGRSQAVMVVAVMGMLSLLVWPLSLVSSAAVALVTLRHGEREGMLTVALAAAATGVLGLVALGSPLPFIGLALMSWVPMWLLGTVLRNTRSLSLTVQAGLVFGVAMIVVYHGLFPDPAAAWLRLLAPLKQSLVESQVVDESEATQVLAGMARWMTGGVAAVFFLQLALSLFLGRWWQSLLYNPGGFREEFHALRASRLLGYLSLGVLGIHFGFGADWSWVRDILVLLLSLYLLHGLAVAHAMVAQAGASPAWLVGLYVLLVIALQYLGSALAATGLADTWMDFRARSGPPRGGGADAGPKD